MLTTGYRVHVFDCPLGRTVGDCQSSYDSMSVGVLELETDSGVSGIGFFSGRPLPEKSDIDAALERRADGLVGIDPFVARNQLAPKSLLKTGAAKGPDGAFWTPLFRQALDQALWDLQAKALGIPLYRLLGGSDPRVPAYASGLDYPFSTEEACDFFAGAAERGFRAFKLKVGFPDLEYEVDRLLAIRDAVGRDATLMVDANEAWSAAEAIVRSHAYAKAGLTIFWTEDPCPRDDFAGYTRLAQAAPFTRINRGESVDLAWKARILEDGAIGVLNLGGHITDGMLAAWLAAQHHIPLTVGNNVASVAVHLAAAIPSVLPMEHSFLDWDVLLDEPVEIKDGHAIAPDRPGHGLTISAAALEGRTPALVRA